MNRTIVLVFFCLSFLAYNGHSATAASATVSVNFNDTIQRFDGWGSSLCWWAVRIGGWSEKNLRGITSLITDPDTGLGLNIFRYNIGGGDNPSHTHMRAGGNVPGYKARENEAYNWSADPNQRAVLQALIAGCPGVLLEAFSNSPPWWMTKSGCSSGNTDGSNNLKDDYYDDFTKYLVEVVKHFHEEWGITFSTLEPLNESEANWWKADGSQEGCHFDRSNQEKIIVELYKALTSAGLEKTIRISVDDANSIDATLANLNAWSTTAIQCIGRVNTHSYSGSKRTELRKRADALHLPLYQSESGPLSWSGNSVYDAGLFMSRRILSDLYEMKAEAWIDWQLLDESANWQLISTDWKGSFSRGTNFFARAHFSRFIRPGWSIVTTNHNDIAAAVAPASDDFGIVIVNDGTGDRRYTLTLSNTGLSLPAVELHRTTSTDRCLLVKRVTLVNNTFEVTVPGRSLMSIRPVIPSRTPLTGTPIIGGGPWNDDTAHACSKALDGDADTYADCFGDSVWVGYDFDTAYAHLSRIRVLPRKGFADRMVGRTIEVSLDGSAWSPIYTVTSQPSDAQYLEIAFDTPIVCSAVRYNGLGDNVNLAEIAFHGTLTSRTVNGRTSGLSIKKRHPAYTMTLDRTHQRLVLTYPADVRWNMAVFRINGTKLTSQSLPGSGGYHVDLSLYPQGTYILSLVSHIDGAIRYTSLFSW